MLHFADCKRPFTNIHVNTATVALEGYWFQQCFHQEVSYLSVGTRACKLCSIPQQSGGTMVLTLNHSQTTSVPPFAKANDLHCWLSCEDAGMRGSLEQAGWLQLSGVVVTSLLLI